MCIVGKQAYQIQVSNSDIISLVAELEFLQIKLPQQNLDKKTCVHTYIHFPVSFISFLLLLLLWDFIAIIFVGLILHETIKKKTPITRYCSTVYTRSDTYLHAGCLVHASCRLFVLLSSANTIVPS